MVERVRSVSDVSSEISRVASIVAGVPLDVKLFFHFSLWGVCLMGEIVSFQDSLLGVSFIGDTTSFQDSSLFVSKFEGKTAEVDEVEALASIGDTESKTLLGSGSF